LHMRYTECRMEKVKSAGLKGMQINNYRDRESRTYADIDRESTNENYDMQNDKNINYNERAKEIIESQKTYPRKKQKNTELINQQEILLLQDKFPEEMKK